jgi:FAD/FMN-containing dehydrogenase
VKQALTGALTGGVYPNFLEGEEAVQRVRDGYSPEAFQRLRELKAKYDPENLLRYSYQIPPA